MIMNNKRRERTEEKGDIIRNLWGDKIMEEKSILLSGVSLPCYRRVKKTYFIRKLNFNLDII